MRTIQEFPEVNPFNDKTGGRIICWISGGVASAIACKRAFEKYGDRCEFVFCNTNWENKDTFRFIKEYEKALGIKVKIIKSERFNNPHEVWFKRGGLSFAHGAPCSNELKKQPRIKFQDTAEDFAQVFGFDYGNKKEENRAYNMMVNNPELNCIFPLIHHKQTREMVIDELETMGIKPPIAYNHFLNNNCIGDFDSERGGCVSGGIGYWQKIRDILPMKFEYMARIEHQLTAVKYMELSLKGTLEKFNAVTMCKAQAKGKEGERLFLKHNPIFPQFETIDIVKGKQPITDFECNGFCNTIQGAFLEL